MANLSNINNKFLVTTGGNVGIGVTGPTAKLHIGVSSANDDTFHIFNGSVRTHLLGSESSNGVIYLRSSANSNKVRINTSGDSYLNGGNVGIGTTSPDANLHVNSENTAGTVIIGRTGTNIAASTSIGTITFPADYNSSAANYAQIRAYSNNLSAVRASLDLNVKSTSGTLLTGLTVYGTSSGVNVGIGTASPENKLHILRSSSDTQSQLMVQNGSTGDAAIKFNVSGQSYVMGIDYDDSKKFKIASSSNLGTTDRITLLSSGNVGIGTISPSQKLEVHSTIKIGESGVTGGKLISGDSMIFQIDSDNNSGTSSYRFRCNGTADDGTELMRIQENGNVGIGTNSPSESLEVMKDGGAIIRLHDPGNNSWKLKADTDFHIYDDSSSDYVTIKNAGQVGIGSTNAASRLEVNGVIQNQNAFDDPTFTVSQSGMSLANGGTLQFTQGFVGTSSPGDTVVFRYNAVSWKSWALDFTFTSTGNGSGKHVCSGNIGGYNNNGAGYNSNFTQNFGTAITVVMTNVGQNNVITFTGDFGVHLMCTMRYSQSGGDGAPTSARASLTYNS